jgi:phage/plasmid-like protein (TIGR03299 family)
MTDTIAPADRLPAWQVKGTVITPGTPTEQALTEAGMAGWDVRTEPLQVVHSGGISDVPRQRIILRNSADGIVPIRPCGPQYVPVQNEELVAFGQNILDDSDLVMDSLGFTANGAKVFFALRTPEALTIGGFDKVQPNLLITSGHDGGGSVRVMVSHTRIACTNQLVGIFRKARAEGHAFTVRHSGRTIDAKVGQARHALDVLTAGSDGLVAEAERLLATEYSDARFKKLATDLFPNADSLSKGGQTRRTEHRENLLGLWHAPTQDGITGTAWGAVQAVVEFADWYATNTGSVDAAALKQLRNLDVRGWKANAVQRVLARV